MDSPRPFVLWASAGNGTHQLDRAGSPPHPPPCRTLRRVRAKGSTTAGAVRPHSPPASGDTASPGRIAPPGTAPGSPARPGRTGRTGPGLPALRRSGTINHPPGTAGTRHGPHFARSARPGRAPGPHSPRKRTAGDRTGATGTPRHAVRGRDVRSFPRTRPGVHTGQRTAGNATRTPPPPGHLRRTRPPGPDRRRQQPGTCAHSPGQFTAQHGIVAILAGHTGTGQDTIQDTKGHNRTKCIII